MAANQIYTYALIKALQQSGGDYVGSFTTYVIKCLKKDEYMSTVSIQKQIQDEFKFKIPIRIIEIILRKAERDGYVEFTEDEIGMGLYRLTEEGMQFPIIFNNQKEVKKEVDALVEDLTKYIKYNSDLDAKEEEIYQSLLAFIGKNVDPIINYIEDPSKIDTKKPCTEEWCYCQLDHTVEKLICDYIRLSNKGVEAHRETLRKMILGAIISLSFEDKVSNKSDSEFANTTLYLDTNVLFSLLGLHYEEFDKPLQELFALIKQNKFKIKTFKFTVNEARRFLLKCASSPDIYHKPIKVNSICAYLKKEKDMPSQEILELASTLESKIESIGIEIESKYHNIDIPNYVPNDVELENDLQIYKKYQPDNARKHDIAAIEIIKEIRVQDKIFNIADSKAMFLTVDGVLSRFNYERDHQDGSIPEVIMDRLLVNTLWLKDPNIYIPIELLIATCCRDVFIKRNVWRKFSKVVRELNDSKELDKHDFLTLYHLKYAETILCGLDEKDTDMITDEFIKEKLKNADKYFTDRTGKNIRQFVTKGIQKIKRLIFAIATIAIITLIALLIINNSNILYAYIIGIMWIVILLILLEFGPSKILWEKIEIDLIKSLDNLYPKVAEEE
ncbi:hypothetical protein [Methanothrix harundinacea]|nr:hypothetical protein [Methanothrix harundinacea]